MSPKSLARATSFNSIVIAFKIAHTVHERLFPLLFNFFCIAQFTAAMMSARCFFFALIREINEILNSSLVSLCLFLAIAAFMYQKICQLIWQAGRLFPCLFTTEAPITSEVTMIFPFHISR